jgi:hypothetical protein
MGERTWWVLVISEKPDQRTPVCRGWGQRSLFSAWIPHRRRGWAWEGARHRHGEAVGAWM